MISFFVLIQTLRKNFALSDKIWMCNCLCVSGSSSNLSTNCEIQLLNFFCVWWTIQTNTYKSFFWLFLYWLLNVVENPNVGLYKDVQLYCFNATYENVSISSDLRFRLLDIRSSSRQMEWKRSSETIHRFYVQWRR